MYGREGRCGGVERHTFCRVASLVVVCEPAEIFIFDPWHPAFVLLVVVVAGHLAVCLLLLGVVGRHGGCICSARSTEEEGSK